MKAWCALVVCAVVVGVRVSAQSPQVRPLDDVAEVAYQQGRRQSATFRSLIGELEQSDVIVHVVATRGLQAQVVGVTRFVAHQGNWRYIRIELSAALAPKSRISVLGHELQHALEIARSGADSAGGVLTLYRTTGIKAPTLVDGWETTAAQDVERRIWRELGRMSRAARTEEP